MTLNALRVEGRGDFGAASVFPDSRGEGQEARGRGGVRGFAGILSGKPAVGVGGLAEMVQKMLSPDVVTRRRNLRVFARTPEKSKIGFLL